MIKIDSPALSINKKEVTAYIQQQMMELQPHLQEKSALQVKLKKVAKGYEAELTALHFDGEIQTIGWNENMYDAIKDAKEGLLEYFVEVADELHPHQRDQKINHIRKHGSLYLH